MSGKKFYYVLIDKMMKPRIAKTQPILFKHLQDAPDSDVKAFESQKEAEHFFDKIFLRYSEAKREKPKPAASEDFLKSLDYNFNAPKDDLSSVPESEDDLFTLKDVYDKPQKMKHPLSKNDQLVNDFMHMHPEILDSKQEEESSPMPTQSKVEQIINSSTKAASEQLDEKKENLARENNDDNDEEEGIDGEKKPKYDRPWTAYYFFKEDEMTLEKAKKKIKEGETYHMFFDGAAENNPGRTGAGYLVYDASSKKVYSNCMFTGNSTNNVAEYYAIIYGMKSCRNLGIKNLTVYGDSQLIIKQVTNKYKVKAQHLWKFHQEAVKLSKEFDKIDFQQIPREQNGEADILSKKAIKGLGANKSKVIEE